MLSNGVYRAKAIQGALGETKAGKEQVAVEFEILDEGFHGQRITWFGYFSEKTMDVTLRALRTMGWQGDDLSDLTGITNNEVSLVVEQEEYEGKWTAKVRWVNSLGGGLGLKAPLAPDRAKTFAARMRAQVLAFDKSEGTPRPSAPRPAPRTEPNRGTNPNDDIPF